MRFNGINYKKSRKTRLLTGKVKILISFVALFLFFQFFIDGRNYTFVQHVFQFCAVLGILSANIVDFLYSCVSKLFNDSTFRYEPFCLPVIKNQINHGCAKLFSGIYRQFLERKLFHHIRFTWIYRTIIVRVVLRTILHIILPHTKILFHFHIGNPLIIIMMFFLCHNIFFYAIFEPVYS